MERILREVEIRITLDVAKYDREPSAAESSFAPLRSFLTEYITRE
jgi:hypothetical protein